MSLKPTSIFKKQKKVNFYFFASNWHFLISAQIN